MSARERNAARRDYRNERKDARRVEPNGGESAQLSICNNKKLTYCSSSGWQCVGWMYEIKMFNFKRGIEDWRNSLVVTLERGATNNIVEFSSSRGESNHERMRGRNLRQKPVGRSDK